MCKIKKLFKYNAIVLIVLTIFSVGSFAAEERMKEDKTHVNKWNLFTKNMHKLHLKLIKNRRVKIKTRIGGYSDNPKFYKEQVFRDAKTGKKISMIQWELKNPKNIHSIEVFVRNEKGEVIRDYSSSYLPFYRNAPTQTLINLWGHSSGMRGFRQFDAGGDLIYEQCEGKWKGKYTIIRLFEDDLVNEGSDVIRTKKSGPYKACFDGVEKTAKKYMVPN